MTRGTFRTTTKRSELMAKVRRRNTSAEMRVRQELRDLGIGYRLHAKDLPGTPDIVNRGRRWAIFVNGCFWHLHEGCKRGTLPKRNRRQWMEKLEANKQRDWRSLSELLDLGYSVLVVWECETRDSVQLRTILSTFLR